MTPFDFSRSKKPDEAVKAVGDVPSSVKGTVESAEEFTEATKIAASVSLELLKEHEDFKSSVKLIEEAQRGRDISDIPLDDEYWGVVNAHRLNHNK